MKASPALMSTVVVLEPVSPPALHRRSLEVKPRYQLVFVLQDVAQDASANHLTHLLQENCSLSSGGCAHIL